MTRYRIKESPTWGGEKIFTPQRTICMFWFSWEGGWGPIDFRTIEEARDFLAKAMKIGTDTVYHEVKP